VSDRPDFTPPPHATKHCRHYSFERAQRWEDSGPRCAMGLTVDLGLRRCCPDPSITCGDREEYTDAERVAWEAARDASMGRLVAAIAAVPDPIPLRTGGNVECPSCGGQLRYDRWHRGAEIKCETPFCCGAHFSIAAGAEWPASPKEQQ
jgi:hypothetical protein